MFMSFQDKVLLNLSFIATENDGITEQEMAVEAFPLEPPPAVLQYIEQDNAKFEDWIQDIVLTRVRHSSPHLLRGIHLTHTIHGSS